MKKLLPVLVIFALSASRAFAIFGVGDIVFDPANTMQVISVLRQAEQQLSTLGKIAGLNTQQLSTMNSMLNSIGRADQLLNFQRGASPNQILNVVKGFPGMENSGIGDLSKLFNSTGVLDVFMGQPVGDWNQMVKDPMDYFGNHLRTQAINRIGGELGLTNAETGYVQWVARMTDSQKYNNSRGITMAASELTLDHWFKGAEQRRKAQTELAAKVAADEKTAGGAQTLNQQLAAGSAQVTTTNQILLTTLQHQQEAAAVQNMNQKNENELLESQLQREQMRNAVQRASEY